MNKQIIAKELVRIARNLIASHSVFMRQFPEKTTLKQMRDVIDDNMINEYDPRQTSSGMASNLKLFDKVFENKAEAQRFLDGYASRYQDCGARFKSPVRQEKKEEKYEKTIKKLVGELRTVVASFMNKMLRCQNCSSTINLKYIQPGDLVHSYFYGVFSVYMVKVYNLRCPVCGKQMKEMSNEPRIKKIMDKIQKANDDKHAQQKQGKFELKWLVIAHRHV